MLSNLSLLGTEEPVGIVPGVVEYIVVPSCIQT